MSAECVRCERPTADGYACTPCANRAADQLRTIGELTEAARDVAHGFSRRSGGGASGKPGSRSPANDDALDVLHEVTDTLRSRIKLIEEERGFEIVSAALDGGLVPDPLVQAATALAGQLEWLRHTLWADEALSEVEECARMIRWVVDGPAPKRYLGPCGAAWDIGTFDEPDRTPTCQGDVYARPGAQYGTCHACKARHESRPRREWLDAQVADKAFRAAHIADAYGINVKTIRGWATEVRAPNGTVIRAAKLKSYYRVGEHVVPWTEPEEGEDVKARGHRLHYVGDVLKLGKDAAARRAEDQAERERRASVGT